MSPPALGATDHPAMLCSDHFPRQPVFKVNLAFQFYDLVATLFVAKLRKVEMVVHHALATVMCYFLMRDW